MSNVIVKDNLAKIAISKNLIKEYKTSESERTVYLDNGTEFQIYLKNPYQYHLGIKIYVNDKSIGNMLVLRPGQSHWLDRFVDNDSKLLFSTYEVDDTPEMGYATAKNGKVRVEFYKERENTLAYSIVKLCDNDNYWDTIKCYTLGDGVTCSNSVSSSTFRGISDITACCGSFSEGPTLSAAMTSRSADIDLSATKNANTATKETGRIEKGSRSDQKFEACDIDFDNWSFKKEDIQILPSSRKQVSAEETRRKYCTQCGKKVGPKDKFCSNCGAKIR